jgi:hypothetical protein
MRFFGNSPSESETRFKGPNPLKVLGFKSVAVILGRMLLR